MGQAAAGVLGAALGSGRKAVAILGDGAMLMQNEINTAATYGIDAVWIVLNDARYGMIAQGMESIGWVPFETEFSRANFVEIARAMGGQGVSVALESGTPSRTSRWRRRRPFSISGCTSTGPLSTVLMQHMFFAHAVEGARQAPEVLQRRPDRCIEYSGREARETPRARRAGADETNGEAAE